MFYVKVDKVLGMEWEAVFLSDGTMTSLFRWSNALEVRLSQVCHRSSAQLDSFA
jgi:hypothetical protein